MDYILVRYMLELKIETSPYSTFVTVNEDDSIQTVFSKLAGNKILSLPVGVSYLYGYKKWILVDLLQITKALLPRVNDLDTFFSEPIKSILDLKSDSPSLELEKDPTLLDLVKLLGGGQFHRIIITKNGCPTGVLSQMDVIRFLGKNLHLLPENLRQTAISSLTKHGVVLVKETDQILEALTTLTNNNFYGVAILNNENKIIGNLSVSDLRGISVDELKNALKLTVGGFFFKTKTFLIKDLVHANFESTFESVMHQMIQKHVHRVYITDENLLPVSVFSTSDAVNHILVSSVSTATL